MRAVGNNGRTGVPLGEVLTKSEDWIELDPLETYTEVSVRLWGRGVVARGQRVGSEFGSSRRLRVRPRQFILSRIDARNGALGLVPPELDGAVVSNDFPAFETDEERLLPEYLGWLSRTRTFVERCKVVSEGTTNRVRLKEDKFYEIDIPLPPLDEQRRIVVKIEQLAAKIDEAQGLRDRGRDEARILRRVMYLSGERRAERTGKQKRLSDVIKAHDSGWSPQCEDHPALARDWAVLKTTCVQWDGFDPGANKALRPGMEPRTDIVVTDGDILITRAGPVNRVGVACVVRDTPPNLMLSDKIVRLVPNNTVVPEFLVLMLGTPSVQEYFRQNKTGLAASQVNITRKKLLGLSVYVPSLAEQRRIVTYLGDLQAKVDRISALHNQTAAELDALLPSILDKAFKGEL